MTKKQRPSCFEHHRRVCWRIRKIVIIRCGCWEKNTYKEEKKLSAGQT